MTGGIRVWLSTPLSIGLASAVLLGQHAGGRGAPTAGPIVGVSNAVFADSPTFVINSYPPFGWYAGYFPPPLPAATYNYLPNYWWTGAYSTADPRQDGYNPSSGYAPETVTTLLLAAFPAKARVTLDGVFVGTADYLGPIQLPMGEHRLRVEAPSYEPSEIKLSINEPIVQQLEVRLNPTGHVAKSRPRQ